MGENYVCVCARVRVSCENERNCVRSYYKIKQAKHYCFTEQSDNILPKIIYGGRSDQCNICEKAANNMTVQYVYLHLTCLLHGVMGKNAIGGA